MVENHHADLPVYLYSALKRFRVILGDEEPRINRCADYQVTSFKISDSRSEEVYVASNPDPVSDRSVFTPVDNSRSWFS